MSVHKVAVIGTGYVGITTGAYLASLGHTVVCADVVAEKVARLSKGSAWASRSSLAWSISSWV